MRSNSCPDDGLVEVAFAGRSNVGKSSLINALVRNGGLARTSNTPGRTQELNFFTPDEAQIYLVDMPGYGFAKAPKEKVQAWTALIKRLSARPPDAGARVPARSTAGTASSRPTARSWTCSTRRRCPIRWC